MKELILKDLLETQSALDRFISDHSTLDSISAAAAICTEALRNGNKIITCGNGGSLCDAAHFAEELTGRYRNDRQPFPAIAVNDPAFLTCVSNDYNYEDIFARYVQGVGCKGDVLLAISTSGRSVNVQKAAVAAEAKGMKVVALTGPVGNPLTELADVSICAPSSKHSDRIQEIHIKVIHILIHAIEAGLGL